MEAYPSVVLFTESTSRGGAEVSLRNLAAALDASLLLTVMGVDREICEWIASARSGTAVALTEPVRGKLSLRRFVRLRKHIAALGPAIFHANLRTMADARYPLAAAVTLPNVRALAVEQLPIVPESATTKWFKRWTSKRLDAHVAVGDQVARTVEREIGLSAGSVRTIHNGVPDIGVAAPRPAVSSVALGTLARLDRVKGLDVLLEAVAGLPVATLTIAGEGPEREALLAQAERLGIGDRLRLLPWSDDARTLFDELDVFVLPSWEEGFPLSITEAMLAGRPVVATRVGSVAEAVVDGATGYLVPPGDVLALRAALDKLGSSQLERERMGLAGRKRALDRFTADAMARAFEALYRQLARGHR